jgi:5,5'-dehydrodivanillate O-demethylase
MREVTWVEGVSKPRISHYIFPSHIRHSAARIGEKPRQVIRFRVPTDDSTTTTYWIDFYPHRNGQRVEPSIEVQGFKKTTPGVYKRAKDEWWGIDTHEQDRVAQESQGVIADRTKEHLASSDQGILMMRKMVKESIEAVQRGEDPMGVIRDASANTPITFDSSRDAVAPLT